MDGFAESGIAPEVVRAILIDERRIELYWNAQVMRAGEDASFEVMLDGERLPLVHWTCDMPWSYGTVYLRETMKSCISLVDPVDTARAGDIRVRIVGEVRDLLDQEVDHERVYTLSYEPYYTQFLTSRDGIIVKGSAEVQPLALEIAREIVDIMLEKIPQIGSFLKELGSSVVVYALGLSSYDVPEHRMGYLLSQRVVDGLGGSFEDPVASVGECNLIRLLAGRYMTRYPNELVFVHEFAHSIHQAGIDYLPDQTLAKRLREVFANAQEKDLWPGTYGMIDVSEYFATITSIWFNAQAEGINGEWDGIRGPVNTRDEMREYDPLAWRVMADIYPAKYQPAPWDTNRDDYRVGEPPKPLDLGERFSYGGVRER
ncbi:MAG: hypothetical protein IJH87_05465 [Atopobiaceae bacterium]|nr:hypothetical protein [Atopobiaceae bacterium]